jgi:Asp-tRNA(Asn)/Glu-tRNA(Gln) amidotransferase A subunit family amidase
MNRLAYDPTIASFLCFAEARRAFAEANDTPRAYLERCLERIADLEPKVHAFVRLDADGARSAADAATARWRAGRPLSVVDGLPVAIKDCFDVKGFPTECNSALFADSHPELDAAHVDALRRGGAVIVGKTVTTELTIVLVENSNSNILMV